MTLPKNQMTDDERDALLRVDLYTFIHRCFLELNPTLSMSEAPHLRVLAAKLSDCLLGISPKRLIICLPPRSLKSISVSVAAVAWLLGRDPSKQIICASYGQDLADTHASATRTIMQSAFYKKLFPWTRLSPNRLAVKDFYTTERGFRMATSVGGVVTGRGADVLIIDDPLKPDQAHSSGSRDEVNDWFDNTFLSRLNNKEDGIIIITMQRLHEDDLVGHLLDRGEDWDVVNFPAIAERDEHYAVQTATGSYSYSRRTGEVLDPSRESLATLLQFMQSMGSGNFAAQFQQNPQPKDGLILQRDWIQRYDVTAPLPDFTSKVISVDTANKSGELHDFSAFTVWGVFDGRYYRIKVTTYMTQQS